MVRSHCNSRPFHSRQLKWQSSGYCDLPRSLGAGQARTNGRCWLVIVPCEFVEHPLEVMKAKAVTTTPKWPSRLRGSISRLVNF